MGEMLAAACEAIEAMPKEPGQVQVTGDLTLADLLGSDPFFEIDGEALHIYWGGYDYDIELSAIPSQQRFLGWLLHLSDKSWPLTTVERINLLIMGVCAAKGWDPYAP